MKLTTEQLAAVLDDINRRVKTGDSFEGNIQYTCMAEGLESAEWEVRGSYRVGNTDGQGDMMVFGA